MSPESIDDVYARWQRNPDAAQTKALCDALSGEHRPDLVDIVGPYAASQLDAPTLVAAARMYIASKRLDEAQSALLAAGRLAPSDGSVYRWLGEVLLLRGDRERAEKVLEKALRFGVDDGSRTLLERVRSLRPDEGRLRDDDDDDDRGSTTALARASTAAFDPRVRQDSFPLATSPPLGSSSDPAKNPESFGNPLHFEAAARPAPQVVPSIPEARDVLDALQLAGIYEIGETTPQGAHTWIKPPSIRRLFSIITLIGLAIVLAGTGLGVHVYVTDKRARQHVESERLLATVDEDLKAAEMTLLAQAEKSISTAFDLESRSPHAALTWLHERAVAGLLVGGADLAFAEGTQRAKAVGIDEKDIAFAHVASFLFQGDTAGAVATVGKWDSVAQDDAWFQLLSGATFERAGDPRGLERYSAAVTLDPDLILARVLLTRAMAVDGDPDHAANLANEFHIRYPTRPEGRALVALAWSRAPVRSDPPEDIGKGTEGGDELPVPLRAVQHGTRATLALHMGADSEAGPSLKKGLEIADTPGIAAWLGSIALLTGDETLARKAALTAVSFSSVYSPARVLAARVALLGGRLDEALKAVEPLPPSSAEAAIVAAAVSYERLDGEGIRRAFDAAGDNARMLPLFTPLVCGKELLEGSRGVLTSDSVKAMGNDAAPWADLVPMDWALDSGDLRLAKEIAQQWRGEPHAFRAVRLARLARYDGKLEDADKMSKRALETGTPPTIRALTERVYTLVALERYAAALALLETSPNVGAPLAKWLLAYAMAAHGKVDEARAIVSRKTPPAAGGMPARIIAASAYAAMGNVRRGREIAKPIVQAGFANPDVVVAAEKLGLRKAVRRGR